MDMDEPRDYHALDRLYAIQSEEREERRGLETRAIASIAAALTAVAFSANAVSSRLAVAHTAAIWCLGIGAGVIFAGVFLSTFALLGGSSATIRLARIVAKTNIALSTVGFTISVNRDLDRASLDVADAAHLLRVGARGSNPYQSDDLEQAQAALATASKWLRKLAGSLVIGVAVDDPTESRSVRAEPVSSSGASDPSADGLREPARLEPALDQAESDARRLRNENAASVTVLRCSSALISIGVFVLVAGVVVLLAQPMPVAK